MASLLEKCANCLLIVACTVIVGEYGYRLIHKPAVQTHGAYNSGQHLDGTPALALGSAPKTLIIVTSSTCQFCIASMPSYKEVAEEARKVGTRVVAICGEPPAVNQTFLASHGIAVEKTLSVIESGVRVANVPSLILVRADGTVIDSWAGRATDGTLQRSVARALGKS